MEEYTKYPVKVSLLVDGIPRPGAEALAIPGENENSYTIVFQPTAASWSESFPSLQRKQRVSR